MQLYDLEQRVFEQQRDKAVRKAVAALSPRQRVVIAARFGLDDGRPRTLDDSTIELAKLDGYTVGRERIRQIECRALRHLKVHGGLHDVAGVKSPAKVFDPAQFSAHQRARKAQREAAEQWRAQQRAASERAAEEFAAQRALAAEQWQAEQRAKRQRVAAAPAVPARVLPEMPQPMPSMHYDWMQSMAELERWRAGGRPVNPFDWTNWMKT